MSEELNKKIFEKLKIIKTTHKNQKRKNKITKKINNKKPKNVNSPNIIMYSPIIEENENLVEKIGEITEILDMDGDFFLDKFYFLLGFKDVVRLEINDNKLNTILRGLEKLPYEICKNFIFVSKDKNKANKAKNLTYASMFECSENNKLIHYKLGRLYGYPKCCVKNFVDNISTYSKKEGPQGLIEHSFYYRGIFLPPLHYPCSEKCPETKKLKIKILSKLKGIK